MRTIVILSLLIVCSCKSPTSTKTDQSKELKATIERIDAAAFKAKIEELPDEQILDVRTPQEVSSGMIEGSLNINYHDADFAQQLSALDKNKPVMVYCAGGVRSAKAAKILKKEGFKEIYDLKVGYGGWKK